MVAEASELSTDTRAAYMRRYRAANGQARAREKAADSARAAALTALSKLHPADYARILDAERAKRGLPPRKPYEPLPPA